jgi:hypothetical protein
LFYELRVHVHVLVLKMINSVRYLMWIVQFLFRTTAPVPGQAIQVLPMLPNLYLGTQLSAPSSPLSQKNSQISQWEIQWSVHGFQQPTAPQSNAPRACLHICHKCTRTFASSAGLKQHMQIQSSLKPFKCSVLQGNTTCYSGNNKGLFIYEHSYWTWKIKPNGIPQYCSYKIKLIKHVLHNAWTQ